MIEKEETSTPLVIDRLIPQQYFVTEIYLSTVMVDMSIPTNTKNQKKNHEKKQKEMVLIVIFFFLTIFCVKIK